MVSWSFSKNVSHSKPVTVIEKGSTESIVTLFTSFQLEKVILPLYLLHSVVSRTIVGEVQKKRSFFQEII